MNIGNNNNLQILEHIFDTIYKHGNNKKRNRRTVRELFLEF